MNEDDKIRFLSILKKNLGLFYRSCRIANLDYKLVEKEREKNKDFAKDIKFIENEVIDSVEGVLLERVKDGDPKLMKLFLEAKAKNRGYGESKVSHDVTVSNKIILPQREVLSYRADSELSIELEKKEENPQETENE